MGLRYQVDGFREGRFKKETCFQQLRLGDGAARLLPSCLDHHFPTPKGSGRTEAAKGLKKACLFQGRRCAMAYRADSSVGGF